jgi:hypothetical protein
VLGVIIGTKKAILFAKVKLTSRSVGVANRGVLWILAIARLIVGQCREYRHIFPVRSGKAMGFSFRTLLAAASTFTPHGRATHFA